MKIIVLPLQLTLPSTAGSSSTASGADAISIGSVNSTARPVVMSATVGESGSGWVSVISETVGARLSNVLAT